MGTRRKARESALQMLFQWDVTHDSIEDVIGTFWDSHDDPEVPRDFANTLAIGTVENVEKLDSLISRHTENWRLDRMAIVDRNLLRLATYEFLHDSQTPKSVVINEA